MSSKSLLACVVTTLLAATTLVSSDPFPTGGAAFYLPNQPAERAPSIATDNATLQLVSMQLPKSAGWFATDKTLGVSVEVDVTYKGSTGAAGTTQDVMKITKAFEYDVTKTSTGDIAIPIRNALVFQEAPLLVTNGTQRAYIGHIDVGIKLLAQRSASGFSNAVKTVFDLTSSISIPTPYSQYIKLVGDGLSKLSQDAIAEGANPVKFSTLGFEMVKSTKEADLSGYYVLLMSSDQPPASGYVDPRNLDHSKLGYDEIKGLTYNGVACRNANLVFRLDYSTSPLHAALAPAASLDYVLAAGQAAARLAQQQKLPFAAVDAILAKAAKQQPIEAEELAVAVAQLSQVKPTELSETFMGIARQTPIALRK